MKASKEAKAAAESRAEARHHTCKRILKGRVVLNKGKRG